MKRRSTRLAAAFPALQTSRRRRLASPGQRNSLPRSRRICASVERRAEDLTASLKRLNDRLYGGQIHDAREMASIEAEISHAKVRHSEAEDEEMDLMERIEVAEGSVSDLKRQVEVRSEARQRELPLLHEERARLTSELEELRVARDKQVGEIDGPQLERYGRLRARLGHAVSRVENGLCEWCRVQLPPADVQHARGVGLIQCTNCTRILFVP